MLNLRGCLPSFRCSGFCVDIYLRSKLIIVSLQVRAQLEALKNDPEGLARMSEEMMTKMGMGGGRSGFA